MRSINIFLKVSTLLFFATIFTLKAAEVEVAKTLATTGTIKVGDIVSFTVTTKNIEDEKRIVMRDGLPSTQEDPNEWNTTFGAFENISVSNIPEGVLCSKKFDNGEYIECSTYENYNDGDSFTVNINVETVKEGNVCNVAHGYINPDTTPWQWKSSSKICFNVVANDDLNIPYENQPECGVFPSVLNSFSGIIVQKNDIIDTCEISIADFNLTEDSRGNNNLTCSPSCTCDPNTQECSQNNTCTIVSEPEGKLEYSVYSSGINDSYFVDSNWDYSDDNKTDVTINNNSVTVIFKDMAYGSYTFSNDVEKIEFQPERTYIDSNVNLMVLNNIRFSGNGQEVVFEGGDYYFNSFEIEKDTNGNINQITLCAKEDIRIFVKESLIFSGNHLNDGMCGGKIFIYTKSDVEFDANGGGNSAIPIFLYSEGDITIENNGNSNEWFGAITAEGAINITGENINFRYDSTLPNGYEECIKSESIYDVAGPFDAWDIHRSVNDRNISTKITNRAFELTIASLNDTNDQVVAKDASVRFNLWDNSNHLLLSSWNTFDAENQPTINQTFKVDRSTKDTSVIFEACIEYDASNNKYSIFPIEECSILCQNFNTQNDQAKCILRWKSSDNFAIRPYSFRIFGINEYKRSGEEFKIFIMAVDEENDSISTGKIYSPFIENAVSGTKGYDAKFSTLKLSPSYYRATDEEKAQMRKDVYYNPNATEDVDLCPHEGSFIILNAEDKFVDGEGNVSLEFSETGILQIKVEEKVGEEWAKVDHDDTPDTDRLISAAEVIHDITDINQEILMLFVPYEIKTISAIYGSTNNKDWLYVLDINESHTSFTTPQMAAFLKYRIAAYNKYGDITKNYTKTCFPDVDEVNCPRRNGLKLNTTFDLFLDMDIDINSSENNATFIFYSEDNSSNAIWTLNKSKSYDFSQAPFLVRQWISPLQFQNGIGEAFVYFNIDRNSSRPLYPIGVKILDANTSTSWMQNPGSPENFIGIQINESKIFYYGRLHAPDYRTEENSIQTPIYAEVYCDSVLVSCEDFNISRANGWRESVDEFNWWINPLHGNSDGSITSLRATTTGAAPNNSIKINNSNQSDNIDRTLSNGSYSPTIEYTGDSKPHKTRINIFTQPWLLYNRFFTDGRVYYDVTFEGQAGNWGGIGTLGQTVDTNASGSSSRRIEW